MKPNLLLFALFALFVIFVSGHTTPEETNAEVLIRNIKSDKGNFVISFYDNQSSFPKPGKELLIEKILVKDTMPHTVKVKLPAEGWYAIAMFQDEDNNGKIKQDKIGIPEEPYGFSNNVHPRVEAPVFSSCKFYLHKGDNKLLEIRLIQPRFHGRL